MGLRASACEAGSLEYPLREFPVPQDDCVRDGRRRYLLSCLPVSARAIVAGEFGTDCGP
jgi:hypothetical protein